MQDGKSRLTRMILGRAHRPPMRRILFRVTRCTLFQAVRGYRYLMAAYWLNALTSIHHPPRMIVFRASVFQQPLVSLVLFLNVNQRTT